MIVLDASAVLELLLHTPQADAVREQMGSQTLHAPHLLDVEVTQVIRRYVRCGQLSDVRAREALSVLVDLPITRYPHQHLLPRVWQLRENLSAYDAVYVALAEALDAGLLTCDRAIAAAPGHRVRVTLV